MILGCNVPLKDGLQCLFPNLYQISQLRIPDTNIPALLQCEIKAVLHTTGGTKTTYRNRGVCKLKP